MSGTYTFISNCYENILRSCLAILPGLDKAVVVYEDKGELIFKKAERGVDHISTHIPENKVVIYKEINKLRKNNRSFHSWLSPEEIPFEANEKGKKEGADIFSESDNITLLLRFKNRDGYNDLIFLYLRPNISNFGISRMDKPLGTENKNIIGHLYHSFLKHLFDLDEANLQTFNTLNDNVKALINSNIIVEAEVNKLKRNYGESLVKLCNRFLEKHSGGSGINYRFSDGALEKIRVFDGDIVKLEKILDNAITFVSNVYHGQDSKEIVIHSWYLNFEITADLHPETQSAGPSAQKEHKTIQLLNKLEKAAQDVRSKKEPLTGNNLGRACSTPISAPAITDALKKHRKKILALFERYPEKWLLIKSDFRPVRNIMAS